MIWTNLKVAMMIMMIMMALVIFDLFSYHLSEYLYSLWEVLGSRVGTVGGGGIIKLPSC